MNKYLSAAFNPFDSNVGPKAVLQKLGVMAPDTPGQSAIQPGQTWTKQPDGTLINENGSVVTANGVHLKTPTAADQVVSTSQTARDFLNQVPAYQTREGAAYNAEGGVANDLNSIAHGVGPSVAGNQLQIGQQQAANQQLAQAAGASGNNAALARTTAMTNTAGLQAQTNQQQALARAKEESDAYSNLANVTGNMANQSGQRVDATTGAGQAFTKDANDEEQAREGLSASTGAANSKTAAGGLSTLIALA